MRDAKEGPRLPALVASPRAAAAVLTVTRSTCSRQAASTIFAGPFKIGQTLADLFASMLEIPRGGSFCHWSWPHHHWWGRLSLAGAPLHDPEA